VQVCEHLPRLARMTDKLAIIRSMSDTDVNHTTGTDVPNAVEAGLVAAGGHFYCVMTLMDLGA
jgi:hypothetical protein